MGGVKVEWGQHDQIYSLKLKGSGQIRTRGNFQGTVKW